MGTHSGTPNTVTKVDNFCDFLIASRDEEALENVLYSYITCITKKHYDFSIIKSDNYLRPKKKFISSKEVPHSRFYFSNAIVVC